VKEKNIFSCSCLISRTRFSDILPEGDQSTGSFWQILLQEFGPDPDHQWLHLEVTAEKYHHEEYYTFVK